MADATCSVEGCENRARKRGWCGKHYQRWVKHGHPERVDVDRSATSSIHSDGYRWIKVPGHPMAYQRGWGMEHRIVAWDHYGPFGADMHVHHKNHDKLDNRPENLEVLTRAEHAKHHKPRIVDRGEVTALYASGLSTCEVARRLGVRQSTIYVILQAEGVRILSRTERARLAKK